VNAHLWNCKRLVNVIHPVHPPSNIQTFGNIYDPYLLLSKPSFGHIVFVEGLVPLGAEAKRNDRQQALCGGLKTRLIWAGRVTG
jgi:hypothetical protein